MNQQDKKDIMRISALFVFAGIAGGVIYWWLTVGF